MLKQPEGEYLEEVPRKEATGYIERSKRDAVLYHADRTQNGNLLTREIIDCGPSEEDSVYFDKGVDDSTNEIKHPN